MKIAIVGYGAEGRANYNYWLGDENQVVIVDENQLADVPIDANIITGKGAFERLEGFDLVVRSPGVALRKIKTDGKIWSATNEFFAKCPAPIIGVTGTKGKGTTSSWVASILRAAGKKVHLVGNIGQPALEVLGGIGVDDMVVYELSSFQLWDLEYSPHVSVALMVEPDHLDMHEDMADYVAAKSNITKHQTERDIVIFNKNNSYSRQIAEASKGQKIAYPQSLTRDMQRAIVLPGAHNQENASAAIAAARAIIPGLDEEVICRGLADFSGLPHRLKFVREIGGVKFYDDSIATTPGSAMAALNAFSGKKVIILGGSSKGADYSGVVARCLELKASVVAIGETGNEIAKVCAQVGVEVREAESIEEAVGLAYELAGSDATVVLSPASASLDMFKNYIERGERFIAAVRSL